MSNLIDKIRTLINAQVRGPRHTPKPQAPEGQQPPAPPPALASDRVPEVTEGRPRKIRVEVSEEKPEQATRETAPQPASTPASRPASAPASQPDAQAPASGEQIDEGRVADMLKRNKK